MAAFDFPGRYYDIIRADYRDLASETDFLAGLLPESGGRVLDLGCGTGANLRALGERGHTGVGVDASAEFVKAADAGSTAGCEFTWADLAEFETTETFDLVYCVFATLNLVDPRDLPALLAKARRWVRPGGHLVVEAAHLLNFVEVYQPHQIAHHRRDDVLITRMVRTAINAHTAVWRNEETLLVRETDGTLSMHDNFFDQWVLTAPELRRLLDEAGFDTAAEYGGFRKTPPFGKGPLIQVATPHA